MVLVIVGGVQQAILYGEIVVELIVVGSTEQRVVASRVFLGDGVGLELRYVICGIILSSIRIIRIALSVDI